MTTTTTTTTTTAPLLLPVSPAQVTKFCKSLGSGKISRVLILPDGSGVFDLSEAKAARLCDKFDARVEELHVGGAGLANPVGDGLGEESEATEAAARWFLELPMALPTQTTLAK